MPTATSANNEDFFSTFLGNVDTAVTANVEGEEIDATQDRSFIQWNAWGAENNSATQLVRESLLAVPMHVCHFVCLDLFRHSVRF